jgi:hypothetical protein
MSKVSDQQNIQIIDLFSRDAKIGMKYFCDKDKRTFFLDFFWISCLESNTH